MTKILGYIAYEGPSMLDGAPIVVIVNKIGAGSANAKTGALVQSFILRADVAPMAALVSGADESICGACSHRPILAKVSGEPPCYVQVGKSVSSVWHAYRRGRYIRADRETIAKALTGKRVRIGTYGDGAAAPVEVWTDILRYAAGHTGYSHQWQRPDFNAAAWAPLVMASADSLAEAAIAKAKGMRTFRVSVGVEVAPGEISCPASKEAGAKTVCASCMLCGGTSKRAKDIVIADHAAGHKRRVISLAVAA